MVGDTPSGALARKSEATRAGRLVVVLISGAIAFIVAALFWNSGKLENFRIQQAEFEVELATATETIVRLEAQVDSLESAAESAKARREGMLAYILDVWKRVSVAGLEIPAPSPELLKED